MLIVILVTKIALYVQQTKEIKRLRWVVAQWVAHLPGLYTWETISIMMSESRTSAEYIVEQPSYLLMPKYKRNLPAFVFFAYIGKAQVVVCPNVYDLNLLQLQLSFKIHLCDSPLQTLLLWLRQVSVLTFTLTWYCPCLLKALLKIFSLGNLLFSFQVEWELIGLQSLLNSCPARCCSAGHFVWFASRDGVWLQKYFISWHGKVEMVGNEQSTMGLTPPKQCSLLCLHSDSGHFPIFFYYLKASVFILTLKRCIILEKHSTLQLEFFYY